MASLLAKCKTQTEIARILGFDQSTISDDVRALRLDSQKFIFDLAKSDLGFFYKQCIDGLQEAKKQAWLIHDRYATAPESNYTEHHKLRLAALKLVIEIEVEKFRLLESGPNILAVHAMSQRLEEIENSIQQQEEETRR